jgi:hypothetical protein
MQFLEISWDFGILGFSKILGFFQRFFGIFDEVYEDFQSNLPLENTTIKQLGQGYRYIYKIEEDLDNVPTS